MNKEKNKLIEQIKFPLSYNNDGEIVDASGRVIAIMQEGHLGELVADTMNELQPRGTEDSAIEILKNLCHLKHYKDNVGKDAFYEKEQPLAWKRANEFLNDASRGEDKPAKPVLNTDNFRALMNAGELERITPDWSKPIEKGTLIGFKGLGGKEGITAAYPVWKVIGNEILFVLYWSEDDGRPVIDNTWFTSPELYVNTEPIVLDIEVKNPMSFGGRLASFFS